MNKVVIAIVAVIVVAGGAFVLTKKDDKSTQSPNSSQPTTTNSGTNPLDPNNYTAGADIGNTLDATDKSSVNVVIDDFIFQTTYLKIKKGTKVTWTNQGQIGHTVTSDDGSPQKGLDSQLLNNGDSYSFTFTQAGTYEYFCTPHPTQMKAVVTVVD